jgi:hypothetical protein
MIDIKHRLTGAVLYTHDGDSLRGADMRGVDLREANLRGADLGGANLTGAYLSWADMRGADLTGADLSWVNMRGVDLRGADLTGADLSWCIGDGKIIRSKQFGTYYVVSCDDYLAIGCEAHRVHEWRGFSDAEIGGMDTGALEWWKQYRESVLTFADCP